MSLRRILGALATLAATAAMVTVGTTTSTAAPAPAPTPACDYPAWQAGQSYVAGDIVRYTDGNLYLAVHANPGYDPVISHWYWDPYDCDGDTTPPDPSGFVVSQAQFNQMFPAGTPSTPTAA